MQARVGAALVGVAAIALAGAASAETIRIGVPAGPHAQILDAVKPIAAKQGLDIKIIEFTDYVIPNAALASGEIEANSFQHRPYLDNQVQDRGFKLVSVGKTVVFPMGIYSKVKKLSELSNGASVAIPNDPTNGGRALLLLQDQGLIKLSPEAGLKATPIDITENPKKLASSSWTRRSFRSLVTWMPLRSTPTTRSIRPEPADRRHRAGERRSPTPTSSRCVRLIRTSPGSSSWSRRTTRRRSSSSSLRSSRVPWSPAGKAELIA